MLIKLRSFVYLIFFYIQIFLGSLVFYIFQKGLPGRYGLTGYIFQQLNRFILWTRKTVLGQKVEWRHKEVFLRFKDAPFILASNHQSAWETLGGLSFLSSKIVPVYKKSLENIPLAGACFAMRGIGVDIDKNPMEGMRTLIRKTDYFLKKGCSILIFPEGQRSQPFERFPLSPGLAKLAELHPNVPIIPMVHNAGLFYGIDRFEKFPGTIVVKFLPPLYGRDFSRKEFMAHLETLLHTESDKLSQEAIDQFPWIREYYQKNRENLIKNTWGETKGSFPFAPSLKDGEASLAH